MLLVIAFFITAIAYASVGFGGGSTYNALLVLGDTHYRLIPVIALTCNILVVTGGVIHFGRAGHMDFRAMLPFVLLSVPMAWLGGFLPISETVFIGLLGFALLATVFHMLVKPPDTRPVQHGHRINPWMLGLPVGGAIGLLSGAVGIGGGIFLAPVLYVLGWAQPRQIAATASTFILVNSTAGLAGQLMKLGEDSPVEGWLHAWPLFLAVLAGGQIGSHLGSRRLPAIWVRRLTAVLVFYVSVRLLYRWVRLVYTG